LSTVGPPLDHGSTNITALFGTSFTPQYVSTQ